ncbi:MAG: phosphoribosylformylglycinamidine synthase subunit PurS, partial [Anaerolineae bacterium]
MDYRLMIWPREADPTALLPAIEALGVRGVESCRAGRLVFLRADLDFDTIRQLAADLLADPVTEDFAVMRAAEVAAPQGREHTIEVTRLPGVTDPAAESLLEAAHRTGYPQLERAAVGAYYRLTGDLGEEALHTLAVRLFANPVVEQTAVDAAIMPPFMPVQATDDTVEVIAVRDRDAEGLLALSSERRLALNLAEMQAIRAYFTDEGRDPTDAELETLAQTWSEHCVHKTFKAHITYNGPPPGPDAYAPPVEQTVGSLLGDYIRRATDELDRSWVQSAFVDNAGIVAFIEGWSLAYKVETRNHPSALEPFGGANTGIGGVIRDVLGGSARPIANTDVLCFGPRDLPDSDLPEGVLHPRRIEQGGIAGIEDYGNKMGIPTVNGAVIYHPGYVANPLVYCGCLGILPEGAHPTDPQPGDLIVVLGGRTGRDGLRGATFSSMEMDTETEAIAGTAVQIGHPINEKQVLEVVLAARDAGLYNAITDCGAGGLSSAVGEMGEHIGARVQLADVPLKYPGLRPWEIWLSEAQERMVLAVPPENWEQLAALAADHDIEAVRIGAFEPTGRLTLHYGDKPVGDMAMAFLHDGLPPRHMVAEWRPPPHSTLSLPEPPDLTPALLSLLAHPTIASKAHIVRIYDH